MLDRLLTNEKLSESSTCKKDHRGEVNKALDVGC